MAEKYLDVLYEMMNTLMRLNLNDPPRKERLDLCYKFVNRRIRGY